MARCSIELEPRTLNELQLNVAREAAVDIVLNSESGSNELASKLLIEVQGLRPMLTVKETTMDDEEDEEQEQNSIANWYKENSVSVTSKTSSSGKSKVAPLAKVKLDDLQMGCDHNCVCNTKRIRIDESPRSKYSIKEPLSAPF